MDNSFSRFSAKLVYFFMGSHIQQDWEQAAKDIEELEGIMGQFTVRTGAFFTLVCVQGVNG